MTTIGSAKIYEFPARGRFAAGARRDDAQPATPPTSRTVKSAVGSGWYHEAAIEEAERSRQN